jgi:hypothetical protein
MESYESRHSNHTLTAKVADIVGVVLPPLRMDSQVSCACWCWCASDAGAGMQAMLVLVCKRCWCWDASDAAVTKMQVADPLLTMHVVSCMHSVQAGTAACDDAAHVSQGRSI